MFEKRGDPRVAGYEGGRSINLALAERGRMRCARPMPTTRSWQQAVMMRGRMVHFLDGHTELLRYGRDDAK